MAEAENKIREIVAHNSPGEAASKLLQSYISLSSDSERASFVSVLAARLAVNERGNEHQIAKIRI